MYPLIWIYSILIDGGAISWSSKKQELVTLSTTEAEYVATTHAAKEMLWLKQFLSEVFRPLEHPIPLYADIALAHNEGTFHARTRHIDICYHFIRYVIENKSIRLIYCPTENMTADVLTKPLPSAKSKHFANALGVWRGSVGVSNRRPREALTLWKEVKITVLLPILLLHHGTVVAPSIRPSLRV